MSRAAGLSRLLAGIVLPFAWLATPQPLVAQSDGLLARSDKPLSIEAEQGVEWRRKEQVYIARGNATAQQGKTSIRADELKAHYRKGAKNKTQFWKVAATGNVGIKTERETATGESAIYMIETGVFVLRGRNLTLANGSQTITATDRIEYRSKDRLAFVIGNAKVVDGERIIRASRFVAYLKDRAGGKVALRRVEAEGSVVITTRTEVIRADRGDYDSESRLATLTGNVKLTRCENQLNGEKAVVNLKTGVSRMVGRVRVLLVPGESAQGCKRGASNAGEKGESGSTPQKSAAVAGANSGAVLTQRIEAAPRPREHRTGAQ